MTINLADAILKTAGLNEALMRECDIFFCDKPRDTEYSGHGEIYSSSFETFAVDGSGGEYVKLEDGSIGYISSEGSVGRVAENMEDLFKFLIHAGCISDFSCKYIYKSDELLSAFCSGYIEKSRKSYNEKGADFDEIRGEIAKKLSLEYDPGKLPEYAKRFYEAASREPLFTCKFGDGEDEFVCDGIISDILGIWVNELVGMTRDEILNY